MVKNDLEYKVEERVTLTKFNGDIQTEEHAFERIELLDGKIIKREIKKDNKWHLQTQDVT